VLQEPLFSIRVVDGVCRFIDSVPVDEDDVDEDGQLYLDPSLDHPLYTEAVDTALSLCDPLHGTPLHVKIVLEWDRSTKEKTITDDQEVIEEHSSVGQLKATNDECTSVTLEECFQVRTKESFIKSFNFSQ
jgi:ubiquitin carboxyl-terminal hydrolase 31